MRTRPTKAKLPKAQKPQQQVELSYEGTVKTKGKRTITQHVMNSSRAELEEGRDLGTVEAWLRNVISDEFYNANESDIEFSKVGFIKPYACTSPSCNLAVGYKVNGNFMCFRHMDDAINLGEARVSICDTGEWAEVDKSARLDSVFPPAGSGPTEPAEEDWPA